MEVKEYEEKKKIIEINKKYELLFDELKYDKVDVKFF
jgi:hypothetical protein